MMKKKRILKSEKEGREEEDKLKNDMIFKMKKKKYDYKKAKKWRQEI